MFTFPYLLTHLGKILIFFIKIGRWITRASYAGINSSSTCLQRVSLADFESYTVYLDTAVLSRCQPDANYHERLDLHSQLFM